ncbi:hypothetical protein [Coleofasciculus chthonoplastes]|uniref:hypothetical protein n=1 Tax=Coleofasciculus chthonoplastes TaxID=64178 RepID=UPI0032F31A45
MNHEHQTRVEHFATLKVKYKATDYEDSSPTSLLYFILRKADLGIEIIEVEVIWLIDHQLLQTLKVIREQYRQRKKELKQLENEFEKLTSKYTETTFHGYWKSTPLYFILLRLDSGNKLTGSEIKWLQYCGYTETITIAQQIEDFAKLKAKYQAIKYQDLSPDNRLYRILKKLEAKERLHDSDITWLNEQELFETLAIFQQQEAAKEAEFAQLKDKYKATKQSDSSLSSPLYPILKNIDTDQSLSQSQIDWLEAHQLIETLDIVQQLEQKRHFAELKTKYKASQYEDSSPSSHLYKVLKKLESEHPLGEEDINFLKKRQLTDTITIAQDNYAATLKSKIELGDQLEESEVDWLKDNERENIIAIAQAKHFATLKSKYNVSDYQDTSPSSPLYAILQKLKKAERLEPTDVAWLQENKIKRRQSNYGYYGGREEGYKLFSGKIRNTYHKIEATFYEQEYQRTSNKWNLPNASSHWRKADQPKQALKLTENLNFDKIKENKLKSALLTTRGGAFRDIHELNKAEKCALKAIEYQPSSHHPYTLMGAICFERGQYSKGEEWFDKAIKRGASPRDQDAEMKRVVKNAKDENKRREVVNYLLTKDPQRYAWAKFYLKKSKKKGKGQGKR